MNNYVQKIVRNPYYSTVSTLIDSLTTVCVRQFCKETSLSNTNWYQRATSHEDTYGVRTGSQTLSRKVTNSNQRDSSVRTMKWHFLFHEQVRTTYNRQLSDEKTTDLAPVEKLERFRCIDTVLQSMEVFHLFSVGNSKSYYYF